MKGAVDQIMRGFGQVVVANSPAAGICVLTGLFFASPISAALGALGAVTVTLIGGRIARGDIGGLSTGLLAVNGVLLGSMWATFTRVHPLAQAALTVLGGAVLAAAFTPLIVEMHRRKSPYVIFSTPYLLTAWVSMAVLCCTDWGSGGSQVAQGWAALASGEHEKAKVFFSEAEETGGEAETGLGWSLLAIGDHRSALSAFRSSLAKQDEAAAHDGVGWSLYRLGKLDEARLSFLAAIERDPFHSDSRTGLGWISLAGGDAQEARHQFSLAILGSPFFGDPLKGLSLTLPDGGAKRMAAWAGELLASNLSLRAQLTPARTVLCWLFFFTGILIYSRISAGVAVAGIAWCVAAGHWLPAYHDLSFAINAVVAFMALGGQYLRLQPASAAWGLCSVSVLAWAQPWIAGGLYALGLHPLCLFFNVALLCGVAAVPNMRVPAAWVGATPERIRVYFAQREVMEECRSMLETSGAGRG